ncbi:hypothetical protein A2U01_0080879 [Trifolium medium]|uniref:Uncharacterized protein n=1 Tax=Trifolium medium TaxID=97028 RepID=A0A392TG93_9FABA|nr:hypothetical protein [Trifolium medium]
MESTSIQAKLGGRQEGHPWPGLFSGSPIIIHTGVSLKEHNTPLHRRNTNVKEQSG